MPTRREESTVERPHFVWEDSIPSQVFDYYSKVHPINGRWHAKRVFKIRKRLLYETSKHLAAALNGGNQEAQDQCIELPEENPSMFERFQLWIYYGNLIFDEENIKEVRWASLLTVYIVAVAHDLPAPQDLTIDIPIDKEWTELTPPTSQVQYLYDNTHKTVPLRKLLVDWNPHCGGSSSTDWFEDRNRLNQEQYRRNYHFANDERQWRI